MAKRKDLEQVNINDVRSHQLFGIGQNKNSFGADAEYIAQADKISELLNGGEATDAERKAWASMGVFQGDRFSSGQGTYEALMSLDKNSKIGVWDIETIGTPDFMRENDLARGKKNVADFFSITEFAMKTVNNKGKETQATKELSMLIRPSKSALERLEEATKQLDKVGWIGLSEDMRRTLSDITQYGKGAKVRKENGVTYLDGHGTKFKEVALGSKNGRAQIEHALNTLREATPIEKALMMVNEAVDSKTVLAGHNVHGFDQRAMLDVLSATKQHFKDSPTQYKALDRLHQNMQRSQLDTLEFFRTYYETPLRDFGGNMTLGNLYRNLSGKKSENAHFALADINMNIALLQKALKDGGNSRAIQSLKKLSKNTVNVGQVYFSERGIGGDGKYDAIYDKNEQGKFIRARDFKSAAINKNNQYEVVSEIQKMMIDGKDKYGITLLNKDTGYYHQIIRDRFDDIGNIFQKNMTLESQIPKRDREQRNKTTEKDRARREYEKLFDVSESKGVERLKKNYAFLDAYDSALDQIREGGNAINNDTHQLALKNALAVVNKGIDEQYQVGENYGKNVVNMRGRLDAERGIWEQAIDRIEKEDFHYTFTENGKREKRTDKKKQTLALSKVREFLENNGTGEREQYATPGRKTMSMTIGGQVKNFDLSDRTAFISSMSNVLKKKGSISEARSILMEVIQKAEQEGMISANQRKSYLKMAEKRFKNNQGLQPNELTRISKALYESTRNGLVHPRILRGPGAVPSELIQGPTQTYLRPIEQIVRNEYIEGTPISKSPIGSIAHQLTTTGVTGQHGKLFAEDVISNAIEQSKGYTKYNINEQIFINAPKNVKQRLQEHEKGVKMALERSGLVNLPKMNLSLPNGVGKESNSIESKVIALANQYGDNFGVRVDFDEKSNKMFMFLTDKSKSESMMGMSFNEARGSRHVAHFEIPMMRADGTIEMSGQQFVGRLSSRIGSGNSLKITNVVDEFFEEMKNHARYLNKSVEDGIKGGTPLSAGDIHARINGKIRSIREGLITNHSRFEANPEKEYRRKSRLANHNRATQIDVTGMAEHWFKDNQHKFKDQRVDKIKTRMKEEGISFFDAMNRVEQATFHREIDGYYNEHFLSGTGAKISQHGLSDSQAIRGVRSTVDNRDYFAFGGLNPTARENLNKAMNYRAMADTDDEIANYKNRLLRHTGDERQAHRALTGLSMTELGKEIKGNEISHLNVRTALSNELQVSSMVKGALESVDNDIRSLEAKANPTKNEQIRLEKLQSIQKELRNASQMSIHDGMIIAAKSLQDSFAVKQQTSVDIGVQNRLDPRLRALMEQAGFFTEEGLAKAEVGKEITFKQLQEAGLIDKTQGGYRLTVGELMKMENGEFTKQKTGEFKNWHKEFAITGFDADSGKAIIDINDRAGQSAKFITMGGGRHTAHFVSDGALEYMLGDKEIKAIMPEVEMKKKMGGAYIAGVVNAHVSEITRQLTGEVDASDEIKRLAGKHKYTIGDLNQAGLHDDILQEAMAPGLKHLGVEGAYRFENGSLILNKQWSKGFEKENNVLGNLESFERAVTQVSGFSRLSKDGTFEVVNEGFAKHDIHTYESTGEKTRVGKKELNVLRSIYGDKKSAIPEMIVGGSDFTEWFEKDMAMNQRHAKETGTMMKSYFDMVNQGKPGKGDVVLDFSGETVGNDVNSSVRKKGVRSIDSSVLHNPRDGMMTARDMVILGEDYAGSIINYKGANMMLGGEQKKIGDVANKGTYLKLPEVFGEERYVPMVDTSHLSHMDESQPMLLEVQKKQLKLYGELEKYKNLGKGTATPQELLDLRDKSVSNIEKTVAELESKTAQFMSEARDGGALKKLTSANVSNSGQFRVQTINPFENNKLIDGEWQNTGEYKEGTMYMSRERVKELIHGNEKNIAEILMTPEEKAAHHEKMMTYATENFDEDYIKKNQKHIIKIAERESGESLIEKALDKMTMGQGDEGLYGNVLRNPTISDSTMQAQKIVIDPNMASDDRRALVSVGTLKLMAADTDGDVINAMLNHYKSGEAQKWHNVIKERQQYTALDANGKMNDIMNDYRQDLMNTYEANAKYADGNLTLSQTDIEKHVDQMIVDNQSGKQTTVQALVRQGFDKETAQNFLSNKMTLDEDIMAVESRQGKGAVGPIDNLRERMRELHTMTQEALVGGGALDAEDARRNSFIVQKFGSTLSQELISSKKLTIDKYADEVEAEGTYTTKEEIRQEAQSRMKQRHEKISDIQNMLRNPSAQNVETLRTELDALGIFNSGTEMYHGERIQKGEILEKGLQELQMIQELNQRQGGLNADALKINESTGMINSEQVKEATLGRNFMPTSTNRASYAHLYNNGEEVFDKAKEKWNESVLNKYMDIQSARETVSDSVLRSDEQSFRPISELERRGGGFISGATSDALGSAKRATSNAFDSLKIQKAAPIAAVFGAIWGASAMLRTAPTPEGLQEQQRAAHVEVAPEQMLTSPTARVTTNPESTMLRISGRGTGGLDHNALAGIVNSEIQQMKGMSLDMNVNVNDNTAKITNSWIQQKLNESLNQ